MTEKTTFVYARANLKWMFDQVVESRKPVYIARRGGKVVAVIAADELRSLIETAHLLRSPANAERLFRAVQRAQRKRNLATASVASLRRKLKSDDSEE
jgi:antitoxin YefM